MHFNRVFGFGLVWLLFAAAPIAHSAPRHAPPVHVVLVHGALIDGSSWRGVYDVLTKDGYDVRIVQEPLTAFDEDVAATRRVLEQLEGPVVLVGHSYGGAVITAAGTDPKVKALVYVAALQPEVGETAGGVAPPKEAAKADLRQTRDGFVFIAPERFAADFGADLPRAKAEFMAHSQMPIAAAAFSVKLTAAAWHDKPSYAIIAARDQALDIDVAKRMAQRAGSRVTVIDSTHAVHIARPREVARVIETAARAIR